MPYRIDLSHSPDGAFDRLVDLGALDVDVAGDTVTAIMPDKVTATDVARAIGVDVGVAPARGRDAGSVWVVRPRPVRVGRLQILPAGAPPQAGALRLTDSEAFGTGLHPTTALCLEALEAELAASLPASVLDVGTGSGVLALAALAAGVPRAVALDIDGAAVAAARENARLNGMMPRLHLLQGGPESLTGTWPLVLANVLAAPLVAMARTLSHRTGRGGRLVLSGIRSSLRDEVERAYLRTGMQKVRGETRDGWTALTFCSSW